MDFFDSLGASAREALGWESGGGGGGGGDDRDAWSQPPLSCSVAHELRLPGSLAAAVSCATDSDSAGAEATLAVGAGDDWGGFLAGAALEWSCSHADGEYEHEATLEVPLSAADGASIVGTAGEGSAECAVRYEHPDGLSAAHFGVGAASSDGSSGGWVAPCGLPYAAGWRHGALAAGLKGTVERGATAIRAPAVRLGFEDSTVSAHLFAEGQPYTAVGGGCQWRPAFAPSVKLSWGLKYAIEVEAGSEAREYSLTMDEGAACVEYQVDQTLATQLRVRRHFGPGDAVQKSAVQYSVQKELTEGFTLGVVWQSPLATVARYGTHSLGLSVTAGGK
jgi:hypothetical protein